MKTGYPFLRISQKHNLDYGLVLLAADKLKNTTVHDGDAVIFVGPVNVANTDICKAVNHFRAQQAGLIPMTDYADVS